MKRYAIILYCVGLIFMVVTACSNGQSQNVIVTAEITSKSDTSSISLTPEPDASPTNSLHDYSGTIYYLVKGEVNSGLWRINLAEGQKVPVHQDNNITGLDVEISPDNTWIAYSNDTWNNQEERLTSLWVVNTETRQAIQVAPPLPLVRWRWLPTSELFYTQYPEYVESDPVLGKPPEPGTNSRSFIYNPATDSRTEAPELQIPWSYQGDQLCGYQPSPVEPALFAKTCRSITDEAIERPLIITQIDTTNLITITNQFNGSRVWSPDGQQLLFSNDTDKNRQLFIWDMNTNETRLITDTPEPFSFFDLTWSPNEQWVAFHEDKGVCVADMTTGEIICYLGYKFPIGQKMSWAPNSQAIVIAAVSDPDNEPKENDLYIISVPDGKITRITDDSSQFEYNPIWIQ